MTTRPAAWPPPAGGPFPQPGAPVMRKRPQSREVEGSPRRGPGQSRLARLPALSFGGSEFVKSPARNPLRGNERAPGRTPSSQNTPSARPLPSSVCPSVLLLSACPAPPFLPCPLPSPSVPFSSQCGLCSPSPHLPAPPFPPLFLISPSRPGGPLPLWPLSPNGCLDIDKYELH